MFWHEFMDRLRVFAAAIGVHVLMAALMVLGTMNWQPFRQDQPTAIAIEAVIVDTSEIKRQRDEARRAAELEERRRQRAAELERQRQRELEQERQREEEAARRQRELEAQRKREAEENRPLLEATVELLERERKLHPECPAPYWLLSRLHTLLGNDERAAEFKRLHEKKKEEYEKGDRFNKEGRGRCAGAV